MVSLLLLLLVAAPVGIGGWWLWHDTPDARRVTQASQLTPSRIVATDGTLLDIIGARHAQPVTLEQVSPHLVAALLATEDRRFHQHAGIDPRRVAGAMWATARGELQGGSTLTQQLARNLFPQRVGHERTLMRKLREAVVALKIERAFSKREILTMYLNHVPFLYNVTGVEMAARTYFDKPAAELDRSEAALLVAMLKGPGFYDPVRWPERARQRRDLVLTLLARHGGGDASALAMDRSRPLGLKLRRHDLDASQAPHFVQQVRRQAQAWAEARQLDLSRDGLTIVTTLDPRLQHVAEQAVRQQGDFLQAAAARAWTGKGKAAPFADLWRERPGLHAELVRQTPAYQAARQAGAGEDQAWQRGLADHAALAALQADKTRLEVGFVALDATNGAVRAYVGARDASVDRFDHVSLAQRQPGSTFKPFVYGAALRAGLSPMQTYLDAPPAIRQADGGVWRPGDGGRSTGEPMTVRAGLAQSRNSITVQVAQQVGLPQVVRFAREMGVERAVLEPVPSLALGTSPVSLWEMVRAYATLAALGVRRDPLLIESILDRQGQELERFASNPRRVLDEGQAVVLVDMLRDAVNQGTGRWLRTRFALKADLAGKTGTTQHNADGWFIGLRPGLVTGAWVGFNDARVTMRTDEWGQGGRNALLVVGDFLREAMARGLIDGQGRFPVPPPAPEPERPAPVDAFDARPIPPSDPHPVTIEARAPAALRQVAWAPIDSAPGNPGAPHREGSRVGP